MSHVEVLPESMLLIRSAAAGTSGAVGPVELQLLIGKVYSQWDKHFASALAVYDGLIEKFPDDFRHAGRIACFMKLQTKIALQSILCLLRMPTGNYSHCSFMKHHKVIFQNAGFLS